MSNEYIIQRGDTLWAISERMRANGDTRSNAAIIAEISSDNSIQNPNIIYAGDTLRLRQPIEPPPAPPSAPAPPAPAPVPRTFSSEDSANYPCQSCNDEDGFTIYLTFDDGIGPGTRETYDVLTSEEVPATFFCVGENVLHDNADDFFMKLYTDPSMQIGNHSMSHAHQFYDSYYGEQPATWLAPVFGRSDATADGLRGLAIDTSTLLPDTSGTGRRSVLMDFEYANAAFTGALLHAPAQYPTAIPANFVGSIDVSQIKYSRFLTARMPGTNTWAFRSVVRHKSSTRDEEGDALRFNGYQIYGWDLEWKMSFQVGAEQMREYKAGNDGFLDLYSSKYIDMDRPTMTPAEVFDTVRALFNDFGIFGFGRPSHLVQDRKLVLLMHERAFRRYTASDADKYSQQLTEFIRLCKARGYKFDVLENY